MKFQIILASICFLATVGNAQYGRGAYGGGFGRGSRRSGGPGHGYGYDPRFFVPESDGAYPEDAGAYPEVAGPTRRGVEGTTTATTVSGVGGPRGIGSGFGEPEYHGPEPGVPGFDGPEYGFYPRRSQPRYYPRGYGFFPPGRGLEGRYPGVEGRYPGVEGRYPGVEGRYPGVERRYPGVEGRYPGVERRYPGVDGRYPGVTGSTRGPGTVPGSTRGPGTVTGARTATSPGTTVASPGNQETTSVYTGAGTVARSLDSDNAVSSASRLENRVVEVQPNTRFGEDGRNTFVAKE